MVASVRYEKDRSLTLLASYTAYCADLMQQAYEESLCVQKEQEELLEKQREDEFLVNMYGDSSRVKYLMNNGLSLLEACEQVRIEEEKWEEETLEWLMDPANRDSDIYSDVFKDMYGYRSRF